MQVLSIARPARWLGAAALGLWLAGCSTPAIRCAAGQEPVRIESLYFGTQKPGGGTVSAEDWQAFLDQVVTPRFPDGLTVLRAAGQWKSKDGPIVVEPSHVLNIVHAGTAQQMRAFAEIVAEYKRRFAQESVLQVGSAACAGF